MSCMAIVGAAMMVGGGLMAYEATRKEASQAEALARAQAEAIERNAKRLQTKSLEVMGDIEEQKLEDIGASRVAAAKSGVRVGVGAPRKVEAKIASAHERNKLRYGQDVADEVQALKNEANWIRTKGAYIKEAGRLKSYAALLGGGYKASQYDWQNVFGGNRQASRNWEVSTGGGGLDLG